MSHSGQTDDEEIHRLRRLVKELLEKQDAMRDQQASSPPGLSASRLLAGAGMHCGEADTRHAGTALVVTDGHYLLGRPFRPMHHLRARVGNHLLV